MDDSTTPGPPRMKETEQEEDIFFSPPCDCGLMMIMTCCSKLAVLPTLLSAVMIIIGVHTELCLTAATSLLLPLVPSDYTERSPARKDGNSLHHLHRSTCVSTCVTVYTLQSIFVVNMYMT